MIFFDHRVDIRDEPMRLGYDVIAGLFLWQMKLYRLENLVKMAKNENYHNKF